MKPSSPGFLIKRTGVFLFFLLLFRQEQAAAQVQWLAGYNAAVLTHRDTYFDIRSHEIKEAFGSDFRIAPVMHGFSFGVSLPAVEETFYLEAFYNRRSAATNTADVEDATGNPYKLRIKNTVNTTSLAIAFLKNPRIGISYDFGLHRIRQKYYPEDEFDKGRWKKKYYLNRLTTGATLYAAFRVKRIEIRPYLQLLELRDFLDSDTELHVMHPASNFGICINAVLGNR